MRGVNNNNNNNNRRFYCLSDRGLYNRPLFTGTKLWIFFKMSCHVYLANIALESCQLVCSVGSHTQSSVSGKQKTLSAEKSDQLLNPPSASNQPSDTRDLYWLFPKCQHNWGDPSGKLGLQSIGSSPGLHILCACDTIMIPFTTRTQDSFLRLGLTSELGTWCLL